MAAQIRPNRLEVTDRFPMLGFTIRTDGSPQRAEVALATSPSLFRAENKAARTSSNFYSSRAAGPLTIARGEAVYVVPSEVLAQFIGQDRLYVAMATTADRNGGPHVDVMPTDGSPYVLLQGLTGRSLRRVRMVPSRQERAAGYGSNARAALEWAGDAATPGMTGSNGKSPASATAPPAASPPPAYDDGFGPLTPSSASTAPSTPRGTSNGGSTATPAATAPATRSIAEPDGAAHQASPPTTVAATGLALADLAVGADRSAVTPPSVRRMSTVETTIARGALAVFAGPLAPIVAAAPLAAQAAGVSIGVGPSVSAGLGAGIGLGVGVVFGPDGGLGVYGAAEAEIGFLASISATAQITIVRGGIESFNGWGMAATISGGEGVVGGASALFDLVGVFQGVSFQLGVGAGLTPIDFFVAVQRQVATELAVAQAALGVDLRFPPRGAAMRRTSAALSTDIPLDPGNGGMSIGSDQLEVGDIILSTTAAAVSGVIRFGSGSDVSHAMLYVGQGGQVVDATAAGVRLRPLADAIADATTAVAFRHPDLSDDQRHIVADKVAEYIGRPYSYWGIVKQARFQVHRALCGVLPETQASACRTFFGQVDLGSGTSNEFFCSELVVAAYQAAGVPITETDPSWSSPDDLAQLALKAGALAYIGHLKAPPFTRRQSLWESLGFSLALRTATAGARAMSGESFTLNWDDIETVPQPTAVSCWAAAAAMVVGWKERVSLTPETIAQIASRTTAKGLDPAQIQQFANEIGLTPENPQSYSVDGFRRILENYGPLWVAAKVPGLHAIVVTGMYADGDQVSVRITDPWDRQVGTPGAPGAYLKTHATGSRYIMRWEDFQREYESAATDVSGISLQILHAPGTDGRTVNRGPATSAGYAQSLRAARAMAARSNSLQDARGPGDSATPRPAEDQSDPTRRVERGAAGSTRWALDQYVGLRASAGASPGIPKAPPVERAIALDDWPLVRLAEGDIQLPLTVTWRYSEGSVGDVAIRAGAPRSVAGWTTSVSAEIAGGPDQGAVATLDVVVRYTFGRADRPDIVAVTELALFGDGTYNRQHRWQQADAGAA